MAEGLPVYEGRSPIGSDCADCAKCPLLAARTVKPRLEVPSWQGTRRTAGGLMIVGEAPGVEEVMRSKVFVGPAGRLINDLLDVVLPGVEDPRGILAISNALLCRPPNNDMSRAEGATEACNGRLFQEIAAMQPRVILAMGNTALAALIGRITPKVKINANAECPNCGGRGQLKREDATWLGIKKRLPAAEVIPCKPCLGRGMRTVREPVKRLIPDWKIGEVAGAVIDVKEDPQFEYLRDWFPAVTRYIIPTYHTSFLLREGDKGKTPGVQMVPAVIAHMQKAVRLLTSDAVWGCKVFLFDEDTAAAVKEIAAYLSGPSSVEWVIDLETHEEVAPAAELFEDEEEEDAAAEEATLEVVSGSPPTAKSKARKIRVDPLKEVPHLIGIGRTDSSRVITIDLRKKMPRIMREVHAFLRDPLRKKVAHNGQFDFAVIDARGGVQ